MLVEILGLLMPVTNKREEIGFVVSQFFGIKRCIPMLRRDWLRKQLPDHFVLEHHHIGTSDGYTLSTAVTTNGSSVSDCDVKDSVHDWLWLSLFSVELKIRSGH